MLGLTSITKALTPAVDFVLDVTSNVLSLADTVTGIAKVATNGMIMKFRNKLTAVLKYLMIWPFLVSLCLIFQ